MNENDVLKIYYTVYYTLYTYCPRAFDESKGLARLVFPDDGNNFNDVLKVYLLYRPGHYDVLYPNK